MASPKIAVYSISDLKNTTDDALPNYLTSLRFQQSHVLTDVRLGLGYSAVLIAGATFLADYKLGWEATKYYTLWAVIAYFALNTLLTLWMYAAEKGKVFVGESDGTLISFASSVKKHTPIYQLTVRYSDPATTESLQDSKILELSAPFSRWFTADGHFVVQPFQQWLATEIPHVARAEARRQGKSIDDVADVIARAEANAKVPDYGEANWDFDPPKQKRARREAARAKK